MVRLEQTNPPRILVLHLMTSRTKL